MNIKQLIIAGILSIAMPAIAFAVECPEGDCDDAKNKEDGSSSQTLQNDSKLYGKHGVLVLKPVAGSTSTGSASTSSKSNLDIPTYTVPKALKK